MRHETYAGVGEWRIELAEKYIVPLCILKIDKLRNNNEEKEKPLIKKGYGDDFDE